jgi:hypothetical protein
VALACGFPVTRIQLIPIGRTQFLTPVADNDEEEWAIHHEQLPVSIAGWVSEAIYKQADRVLWLSSVMLLTQQVAERRSSVRGGDALWTVQTALKLTNGDVRAAQELVGEAWRRAQEAILNHWDFIGQVAQALRAYGFINGQDFVQMSRARLGDLSLPAELDPKLWTPQGID